MYPPWCLACPGYHMDEGMDEGGYDVGNTLRNGISETSRGVVSNSPRTHFQLSPPLWCGSCLIIPLPRVQPLPRTGWPLLLLEMGLSFRSDEENKRNVNRCPRPVFTTLSGPRLLVRSVVLPLWSSIRLYTHTHIHTHISQNTTCYRYFLVYSLWFYSVPLKQC